MRHKEGRNIVEEEIEFARDVREIVLQIPRGKVLSYGDVASLAGRPTHARQVGKILGSIGFDTDVPCHRVVNFEGRTAPHWLGQAALLRSEGVGFTKSGKVEMNKYRWHPEEP